MAVKDIVNKIELKNIVAKQIRAENFDKKFDFIVSRAVTKIDNLVPLISNNISKNNKHKIHNGLIYLKGGELSREMRIYSNSKEFKIKKIFKNDFFESKKVLYIPL